MRMFKLYFSYFILASVSILLFSCINDKPVRVICVGDSITEGDHLLNPAQQAYPSVLRTVLGDNYEVVNCGFSGATIQKQGDIPYWNQSVFANAMSLNPDIVVIKLGTNDTKPQNWRSLEQIKKDYELLIDTLSGLKSSPKIIVCTPIHSLKNPWGITDSLTTYVASFIRELSLNKTVTMVDLNMVYPQDESYLLDNIHPTAAGAATIAKHVAKAIINI